MSGDLDYECRNNHDPRYCDLCLNEQEIQDSLLKQKNHKKLNWTIIIVVVISIIGWLQLFFLILGWN